MSFPEFSCLFASLIAAAAAPGDIHACGRSQDSLQNSKKKNLFWEFDSSLVPLDRNLEIVVGVPVDLSMQAAWQFL